MHYLGIVIVNEPTQKALDAAMEGSKDQHWDWFRPGGRWDGWLLGDDEMKRRETDRGFNFSDENKRIDRNCCRVGDLRDDKSPWFFVAKWSFVKKEIYVDGYPSGRIVANDAFEAQWGAARDELADKWAIVVDAHN